MSVAYNPVDSNSKNDNDLNINPIIDSKIEIDHVTEDMYVLKDLRQHNQQLCQQIKITQK